MDASNFEVVLARLKTAALSLNRGDYPVLIPGLEFTHLPPALIAPLTAQARALGVPLILVHGESLAEPVAPGTNRAAIEADKGCTGADHEPVVSRAAVQLGGRKLGAAREPDRVGRITAIERLFPPAFSP